MTRQCGCCWQPYRGAGTRAYVLEAGGLVRKLVCGRCARAGTIVCAPPQNRGELAGKPAVSGPAIIGRAAPSHGPHPPTFPTPPAFRGELCMACNGTGWTEGTAPDHSSPSTCGDCSGTGWLTGGPDICDSRPLPE